MSPGSFPGKSAFEANWYMKRLFFFLFLVFFVHETLALTTVISGEAQGAEGKKVLISRICSLVPQWTIPLAEIRVDANGHFSLQLELEQTICAILSIDFHKSEIFLIPGGKYNIQIAPLNDTYSEVVNPFTQAQSLQIDFPDKDPGELNNLIGDFNALYDAFVLDHFNEIYRGRNKVLLDSFRVKVSNQFGSDSDPYFRNYCLYKLASIEQVTMAGGQSLLTRKYFMGQPVLYANPEYMAFFQNFFIKYLTATSRDLRRTDYQAILRGNDSYSALMKVLGADTILKNEQFRELVLMQGLLEFIHTPGFPPEEILSLLRSLQQKTRYPDNNRLAWDLIQYLTCLKPGTPAPEFSLTGVDKKIVSLKSFKGIPLLLWFWTTSCQTCLNEMDILQSISEKFKNKIAFVGISADKDLLTMQYFLKQKQSYKWNFLHIGDATEVLIAYEVRTYPLFVLIDKQGNIFSYPADFPGNGLEASIEKVLGQ